MLSKINNIITNDCKGSTIKLLIRHSIRPSLKGIEKSKSLNVGLTEEGVKMAYAFGEGLSMPIGSVASSQSIRCIQTLKAILDGANTKYSSIVTSKTLTNPAIEDYGQAEKTLCNTNLKQVACSLSNDNQLAGFSSISSTAEKILDYIFTSGNIFNTLDLYCTHDFNIAILLMYLLPSINTYELISENWPKPLEGLLICGNRNDFSIYWRGNNYHYSIP